MQRDELAGALLRRRAPARRATGASCGSRSRPGHRGSRRRRDPGQRHLRPRVQVDLRLLDVDELARPSGQQGRARGGTARRRSQRPRCSRDPARGRALAASGGLRAARRACRRREMPRSSSSGRASSERGPELLQANVLGGLPVMDDAGDVWLEGAGELAAHGGGPVRPLGLPRSAAIWMTARRLSRTLWTARET